jgi:hypothetical protein
MREIFQNITEMATIQNSENELGKCDVMWCCISGNYVQEYNY